MVCAAVMPRGWWREDSAGTYHVEAPLLVLTFARGDPAWYRKMRQGWGQSRRPTTDFDGRPRTAFATVEHARISFRLRPHRQTTPLPIRHGRQPLSATR